MTTQVQARREWLYGQSNGFERRDMIGSTFTWHWYDAEERLRYTQQTTMPDSGAFHTRISEYRYDALGRRIAVRSRVDSTANCAEGATTSGCLEEYTVTTWDGDQVLSERRLQGGWRTPDAVVGASLYGAWYGKVRYMQTGAIDAPLVVWKDDSSPRALIRNWRGNVAGARFANGAGGQVDVTTVWPAAVTDVWYRPDSRQSAPTPNAWLGSLVEDGRDATGTLYRRNRYYDPATGRFTQEDPIGLAGGLNLYGYAGGDPINFSDPFGLSDCKKDSQADGSKDCSREVDGQADGYKGCDFSSGEGCSAEQRRLIASDRPIEQAGQVVDAVAAIASGSLALRAGVMALRARAAVGVAVTTQTGLGIMDGIRAQLPSGDHQVFIPTGSPRQKAVSTGVYVAIAIVKRKLNVDW